MRIRKELFLAAYSFCLILGPITRSIYVEGYIRLFGLHESQNVALLGGEDNVQENELVVTMDKLRRINSCFIPEMEANTWYAPMVFYKRYKHLSQIYKKCSILRLKGFCEEFSEIVECPRDSSSGKVHVASQGKEASTIFAMLKNPKEKNEQDERFELFMGCVYELGKRSSLRVRCLHSNKAKKFPLKIVIKVDGRTDDFLYHFNHELIIYSRMASSTYGASRVRLHPSIYSVFLQPNRRIISKNVLLMEYIEGPAISSIISELIDYPNLLKYLKNRVNAILEESIRIYDSKFPSLRSDENISVESKARLLENSINIWISNYAEKTMVFSVNLYRRLLYLLDLFHRGGTSFYPGELEDFSRGKWKTSRSFRIHCDFHQGNILVSISEKFKSEKGDTYNLTFRDILDIDLYNDLKIIDLEDAVELKESDFPIPIDKLIGTHPCPVYLTDAEGFSARLLSNIILISNTLSQSLLTLQDYFSGGGTKNLIFENKIVSDWITGNNLERSSELGDYSFQLKDSILKKLKIHSDNWDRYVEHITNDDLLKPCISYYHIKYGKKPPPKSQLPCSWLSNILFSQKACHYLEISHANFDSSILQESEDKQYETELREIFKLSNMTKCQIEETEALKISTYNVSSTVEEFLPTVSEVNETSWGEWSVLFKNHTFGVDLNTYKSSLNTASSGVIISNSNSKKVSEHNSFPCSNHLSIVNSKSNMSRNENKDKALKERQENEKVVLESKEMNKNKYSSSVLGWMEANQVVSGKIKTEKIENFSGKNDSDLEIQAQIQNDTISKEFDKILLDLMGLAALQRIISFCLKFNSEIDCDNISGSKIFRDGPISSYIVKAIDNSNSTQEKSSNSSFVQYLDSCLLYSNETFSDSETPEALGWLCSKQNQDEDLANEKVFKIVVDGRLFLDVNMTFVNQSNDTFAFQDVLGYFGVNDTWKYTSKFNQEVVSMIKKHKNDALEFWKLESKLRNMDRMISNQGQDVNNPTLSGSVLSKMFIFHSKLNTRKTNTRIISISDQESIVMEKHLYFLPLSGKSTSLSRQISSIIQTGLLSENVFFMVNSTNNLVSSLVSKVSNFQNEVFSLIWISYSTLVLSIIESVLRSHSYQVLLSHRTLELLQRFRSMKDFDISIIKTPKDSINTEIKIKHDYKPVICNFSLRKISLKTCSSNEILKALKELNNFSLINTNGAKFIKNSEAISEICSTERVKDKSDIQVLIKDLILPSLDPVSTLKGAVDTLSKVKYNSSIEVRRSNWFVKHVCSFISEKLVQIKQSNSPNEGLPTLIKSLSLLIELKDKILLNNIFSKCIKVDKITSNFEFLDECTLGELVSISEIIQSEMSQMLINQKNIFENSTSINLAQELISYINDHLQIPPPEEVPPFGGLGHLFKKELNENIQDNSTNLYDRNKTIAFDVKWPIIANISDLTNSEKNITYV